MSRSKKVNWAIAGLVVLAAILIWIFPPTLGFPLQLVTVGPALIDCDAGYPTSCLVVDGGVFYDAFGGFDHELGYDYRILALRFNQFSLMAEPPQDTGRDGYRLLFVLSKTAASGMVREAMVAPVRVNCPKSNVLCFLIDGQPSRGQITGFEYEPGFDYRIRYESFGDGSRLLRDVISKEPADGTVEVITLDSGGVHCYENVAMTVFCLVVNGEPFYGRIGGLSKGPWSEYVLRVERYDLMPEVEVPPLEPSKFGYRLLEILSETEILSPDTQSLSRYSPNSRVVVDHTDQNHLEASVHDVPKFHDGSAAFTFELRFSDALAGGFSYETLRDHAFTVTGGQVTEARRLEPGQNFRWETTVRPSGDGAVTVVLPVTWDCGSDSAICAEDGRQLWTRIEVVVPGP